MIDPSASMFSPIEQIEKWLAEIADARLLEGDLVQHLLDHYEREAREWIDLDLYARCVVGDEDIGDVLREKGVIPAT